MDDNKEIINTSFSEVSPTDLANGETDSELLGKISDQKLIESLNVVLDNYNKKYNKNVSYESFFDGIEAMVYYSQREYEEFTALTNDLLYKATHHTKIKLVYATLSYVEKLINSVFSMDDVSLSPDNSIYAEKLFKYIEMIDTLQSKLHVSNLAEELKENSLDSVNQNNFETVRKLRSDLDELDQEKSKQ